AELAPCPFFSCFYFNDPATTETYTLSLHDALPIWVDYDGTHSRNASSINYDIGEYARTVVLMLKEFCAEQGLPHPHIFSESGRRSEEHTSELQSRENLVCRLLLEKKKKTNESTTPA